MKRNLILTAVVGYDAALLRPLVESWKRNVPDADLVMFADHVTPETVAWLHARGVQVIPTEMHTTRARVGWRRLPYTYLLRASSTLFLWWLRLLCGRIDSRLPGTRDALLTVQSIRWRAYRSFLRLHRWRYADVLLVDCRDTVFQRTPFPCPGLHSFAEDETIGASHFAKRWFQLSYGHRAWVNLSKDSFLCSGTVAGDSDSILAYLELMERECRAVIAMDGIDQACHNYIVHHRLVNSLVHPFGQGVAINLNAISLAKLRVIDGRLVDADLRPYPVVHQYDRVKGLTEQLRDYVPEKNALV